MAYQDARDEFNEIMAGEPPTEARAKFNDIMAGDSHTIPRYHNVGRGRVYEMAELQEA